MVGQTISHYKIVEKLGEGGMGAVYKAEDTKLERTVALKFLLPQTIGSEEERQRFIREARAAASLSHPNICTVYEIDEAGGHTFIAMEYVEGETLKDKIETGPLRLKEAVEIAAQIADGLQEAHHKGIIHRDVKPANVMVTSKGQAKIMDFGIAKSTDKTVLTKTGMTLGTVAYMSPEQIGGEGVDGRSDIWSAGAVLYEMITGLRPFRGGYEQAVLYAILNTDPEPVTALRTGVPMELERIVSKAMAKDKRDRYQHVEEMPVDLRAVEIDTTDVSRPTMASTGASAHRRRPSRREYAYAVGGLIIGIVIGTLTVLHVTRNRAPQQKAVVAFTVALQPGQELSRDAPPLAISPDGKHLVYAAGGDGGGPRLFVRDLDRIETAPIPGTEGARDPFFSPDGKWVGFFAGGKLKKVSLAGGAPMIVCDARYWGTGASWDSHGGIIFPPAELSGLVRVSGTADSLEVLTTPNADEGEICHRRPCVLPDGDVVIFTVVTATAKGPRLTALDLETGERKTLLQGANHATYLPSGHLVYAQAGGLRAVGFDPERLEITGAPVPVLDGVYRRTFYGVDVSYFAVSAAGNLAYVPGAVVPGANRLVWADRTGAMTPLIEDQGVYRYPKLSPDGKRLAVVDFADPETSRDLWIYDVERGTRTRLTSVGHSNVFPVWTPDGEYVTFASDRFGPMSLFYAPADGSGEARLLLDHEYSQFPESWSPDGSTLAFTRLNPETGGDIYTLKVRRQTAAGDATTGAGAFAADSGSVMPFVVTPFYERSPRFSPDGSLVAYASDESGRYEVYVRSYPGPGGIWGISSEGGKAPVWSPDGDELFYMSGDNVLSVAIQTEPEFKASLPETVFAGRFDTNPSEVQNYDVSFDGERFIMIEAPDESAPSKLNVIVNWLDVLNELTSPRDEP